MFLERYISGSLRPYIGILEHAIIIAIILIGTFLLSSIIKGLLNRAYKQKKFNRAFDKTSLRFMKHFLSALIYVIGFGIAIYTIPTLRSLSVSLFAGAGILAVIIGFASQAAFSNIISGIFISLFKPFRVGDRIIVQNITGVVEDITLRHTIIKTFENIRYIIPNSKISDETIENYDLDDEKVNKFIDFSISYDSDIDKAISIIQEEVPKHKDFIDGRTADEVRADDPPVIVRLISFGESAINLRTRAWTKNAAAAFRLHTDVNMSVKKRFDKEGIEIPYPHRTMVFKTDILDERKNLQKAKKTKGRKKAKHI